MGIGNLVVLHLGHQEVALIEQLAQPLDAERAELELLLELVAVQRLQPVPVDQVRMLRLVRVRVRLRVRVRVKVRVRVMVSVRVMASVGVWIRVSPDAPPR